MYIYVGELDEQYDTHVQGDARHCGEWAVAGAGVIEATDGGSVTVNQSPLNMTVHW